MRPNTIDIDVADASLIGILENATGAGPWAAGDLDATAPTDGLAHQLSVDSGAVNLSTITMTITGTDADGKVQTEDLTLGNAAVVETTKYYATVSSLSVSATLGANTVDIGWVDEVASKTYPIDRLSPYQANVQVDVTGTINFTVQELWANVYDYAKPQQDAPWLAISALTSKTADTASQATTGATAVRVIVNSYSTGAELQMYTSQTPSK
jgi:hypothetical protein